jgi:hypothetical protein
MILLRVTHRHVYQNMRESYADNTSIAKLFHQMKENLTLHQLQNLLNEAALILNDHARKTRLKNIIKIMDAEDRAA